MGGVSDGIASHAGRVVRGGVWRVSVSMVSPERPAEELMTEVHRGSQKSVLLALFREIGRASCRERV